MELQNIYPDFPLLEELIEFYKIDYQRVEARISTGEKDYTYTICQGVAYIYNINQMLVKSIMV